MDYQHWLREAISQLQASESPRRDAEILLEFVTGKGRTFILAFGETVLTEAQCQRLDTLLERRQRGEPVAHLTGVREFWSLPLFVSPATLIPRPDTECLVEQALARLPASACRILDLGTGTGAIALALATERPDCAVTAVGNLKTPANTIDSRLFATVASFLSCFSSAMIPNWLLGKNANGWLAKQWPPF